MNTQDERKAFEAWAKKASNGWASFTRFSDGNYATDKLNFAWAAWQESNKKLEGCVVVPVELSEAIAEKLALEKVEKPRQENDVVWQEIADKAYSENLKIKKLEIKRDYKEFVEAARGGNE